ncbi:MAG: hypothetical protein A3K83_01220 [Omnitrophica WOR_2 bacterium RBG_13_44_8b]|nr:MAG: hypothetical protein A3K83_01220 [Omnitrophica WOR_2 bacterium RBG_13_44_8b]
MELLITVVIVGVLATIGFVNYSSFKESTLDREAKANLRLIVAAERIYRIEVGAYYAAGSNAAINSSFRLMLPVSGTINWNYLTTSSGGSTCAQSTRSTAPVRTWRLRLTEPDPVSGNCP